MDRVDTLQSLIKSPRLQVIRDYRGNKLKEYLAPLISRNLFQLQKDALIGGLLGDGTLQYRGKVNPYYKFDQTAAKKEYIDLLYSIFDEFIGTPPRARLQNGEIHSYSFRTFRLTSLNFYAQQFYHIDSLGNRKKIVPPLIHRWLNPQSLAFWYMDDGGKDHGGGYRFHTEGFLQPDVLVLQQALGRIFNLQVNLQKGNSVNRETSKIKRDSYNLYIPVSHAQKFRDIVEPLMVNCMKTKLHPAINFSL
jgi:hypothetical protein